MRVAAAATLIWVMATSAVIAAPSPAPPASRSSSSAANGTVRTVNGHVIREADLETLYLINGLDDAQRETYREALVDQLIDRALIEAYLKSMKVTADPVEVEARMDYVRRNIEKSGLKTAEVLQKRGLTEATLRQQVALPIAWAMHCRQALGPKDVAKYFEEHRAELDGTKVRIRQIVRVIPMASDESRWKSAQAELATLRESIAAGRMTAEEAARKHSDSPSRDEGGIVDWFGYDGKMPGSVTAAAFALKPGELSKPVVSSFGVHLVELLERRPGQLSAEDVRPQILERLARIRWDETVASLRKSAKITRPAP